MRWLLGLFGFLVDCLWAIPVALWRGLTGYVPPDPWQHAIERDEIQEEASVDDATERLMMQIDEARRRLDSKPMRPSPVPLSRPLVSVPVPANDDMEPSDETTDEFVRWAI